MNAVQRVCLGLLAVMLVLPVDAAEQADSRIAGKVRRVQGGAVAMQDAMPRPLAEGVEVLLGDVISTGRGARLEVAMGDGSVLTLGERTTFNVEYPAAPSEGGLSLMRLVTGSFAAVSGTLPPGGRIDVETPVATVGIRGTSLWGGEIDGVFQVALLDGKAITIENKAGKVEITQPGLGTRIPSADEAPSEPRTWPAEKLARAKATVAFDAAR